MHSEHFQKKYQEEKALALVLATGNSGNLAKVEAAKTLTDIQVVLNQMLDDAHSD